jgi:hypothetical protein
MTYRFPAALQAHWIRFVASENTNATATLTYN